MALDLDLFLVHLAYHLLTSSSSSNDGGGADFGILVAALRNDDDAAGTGAAETAASTGRRRLYWESSEFLLPIDEKSLTLEGITGGQGGADDDDDEPPPPGANDGNDEKEPLVFLNTTFEFHPNADAAVQLELGGLSLSQKQQQQRQTATSGRSIASGAAAGTYLSGYQVDAKDLEEHFKALGAVGEPAGLAEHMAEAMLALSDRSGKRQQRAPCYYVHYHDGRGSAFVDLPYENFGKSAPLYLRRKDRGNESRVDPHVLSLMVCQHHRYSCKSSSRIGVGGESGGRKTSAAATEAAGACRNATSEEDDKKALNEALEVWRQLRSRRLHSADHSSATAGRQQSHAGVATTTGKGAPSATNRPPAAAPASTTATTKEAASAPASNDNNPSPNGKSKKPNKTAACKRVTAHGFSRIGDRKKKKKKKNKAGGGGSSLQYEGL